MGQDYIPMLEIIDGELNKKEMTYSKWEYLIELSSHYREKDELKLCKSGVRSI